MPPEKSLDRPTGRRVAALIRHGHFPRPDHMASAHLPLPLSDEGRDQARGAADTILRFAADLGLEIDVHVESSRLLRASQTARILAGELGLRTGREFEVEDRDELLERGLGSCANLRFDEIEALLAIDPRLAPLPRGWRRIPDFRLPVPGAESLLDAGRRAAARIEASLAEMDGDAARDRLRLFVAHAGCLRHAAVAGGALAREHATQVTMGFAQAVLFEISSDGVWTQVAGDWKKRLPASPADAPDDAANAEPVG